MLIKKTGKFTSAWTLKKDKKNSKGQSENILREIKSVNHNLSKLMDTNTYSCSSEIPVIKCQFRERKISNNKILRNYGKNKLLNIGQRKEENHHQAEMCTHWVGKQQSQMEASSVSFGRGCSICSGWQRRRQKAEGRKWYRLRTADRDVSPAYGCT